MMLRSLVCSIAVVLALATSALAQQGTPTVVIIVRHAEKAAAVEGDKDPPLSESGAKRAERLAGIAEEAGVSAAYTTQFKRTRDTAQPAAARLKFNVTPVEVTRENADGYAAALAKEILSKHKGKTVLVVGHSNTTPQIVEALSGRRVPPIDDATEFDAIFVVVIPDTGAARLVRARY